VKRLTFPIAALAAATTYTKIKAKIVAHQS
jgi:hypothetical protein